MSRTRTGRHTTTYLGALCLLVVATLYCAPLLLSAAGPERRSTYPYPGWSLGQPLVARAADILDRIRPRRPARGLAASPSPDVPNNALHFDGVDDRVTFGAAPSLGATTFTIETWFRRDGPGATATTGSGGIVAVPLVTKGMSEADGDNRDTNYFLGIDGKRRVLAADFEDTVNGGNHPAFGVTPICDGIWYHAAATYDGTTWRVYLNGNLESQVVVGAFTPRFDSIQHAGLGTALNSSGSASGAFTGALDEVRIWNVVRNASDIQSNMSAPLTSGAGLIARWALDEGAGTAIADGTGNGNTGTLLNGVSWTAGTPFVSTPLPVDQYGVHLKGTTAAGDYVSFGTASALGSPTFTVETWFKRDGAGITTSTGTGGLTAVVPLVTKGRNDGEANTLDINYFLGLSGSLLAADFEEGATGASPGLNHPLTGVTPIQNNVWYHGAVTYDGTTLQLFLNGALEGSIVVGQPPRSDSIEQAALGTALNSSGTAAPSGFFAGTLDEARIWNYARTPAQIAGGKDREIAAASGLLGRWSFNECCGQVPDSSGHNQTGTMFGSSWTWVPGGPLTGSVNAAPSVNAGLDQTITLPATALLSASITDDGIGGAPVTMAWTQTSGPGTVTFGNPLALASTASFSVAGTYVLTLTADDGELTSGDAVIVTVNPAPVVNLPPVVNAGPDQSITLPASASLSGLVVDDGLPGGDPLATWSKVSGPGTVTFAQPSEWATTATFSSAGSYVLMLSASDGALTGSDTLTVVVTAAVVNKAIDFGGTNSYVTFGPAPGLGAATFTIEAWFRRDGTGTTTTTGTGGVTAVPLVTKGRSENDGSVVDMNYFLGIGTGNVLVADFEEGVSAGGTAGLNHPVLGLTPIVNNVWYHAAATYDGQTWRLFLNGVQDGTLTLAAARPPRSDSIQHAAIGSALNSTGVASGFFDGVIDEVRIWNAPRTAQQISDGMTGEILSAPGLLGRWGLNEGSGTIVADSSGHLITGTVVGANWSWGQGAPFNIIVNTAPAAPTLVAPANGGNSGSPATLNVSVSDADGDHMTATFYGRQKSVVAPDFTLVTLPDTQHYVDNATFPATFTAQTNWIVANQTALNVAFVSHLGDVTQNIDQFEIEWQRATSSMAVLDASSIPHGMSPGNHDESAAGIAAFYDQYFPVSRFSGFPWYLGYLGQEADDPVNRQNKNNYEVFSVGGLDFLVIHIELDWPDYSVAWADKIIKRYPNRRVILSSHAFLNTSNARPTSPQFRSNGTSAEAVWQQLIKPNCNVFMVINGHYPGEGRRTDLNNCGQPVHQVLMDYQDRANGGDGWLRYFTFKPSENKIYGYTYSVTRNGGLGEFETDSTSQFVLDYDMQGVPFSVIGTNANVASGTSTATVWSGLSLGTDYEWYVSLNDSKVTTTGPVWSFKAAAQGNTAPVAANDSYVVGEDLTLNVTAPGVMSNDTDPDENNLSVLLVAGPIHGALALNVNGSFTYTPAANFNGSDSFTYKVNDGTADSNVATVTITITPVNDAPVAAADAATTLEDTPVTIAVLANDTDADGDILSVTTASAALHGNVTVNPDGTIVYAPAANYSGPDSFTYTIGDGHGGTATATVNVTVTSANDAPLAVNDSYSTNEDTALIVSSPGLLANDTDADTGTTLTATLVASPAHGTVTVNANGSFTYTPAANYNGGDSFTYKANDGTADSNVATVSITVTAVNDAPVAASQSVTALEDTATAVPLGATDVEGSPLTYAIVTGPAHGSLSGTAPALTYTPAANYNGADSFTFKANDGSLDSSIATVTITVTAVNDAPVAADQAVTAYEDAAKTITLSATDIEGSPLTYAVVVGPAHGTLSGTAPALTYTPAANYNGADSFTFKANDGSLDSSIATVTITVTAVNDAPVAADQTISTDEDTAKAITLGATDVEGSALTYAIVAAPAHGTLSGTAPALTYTPAANYNGADSFTFKANDGSLDSNVATVTIAVTAVNDAPVAVNDAATTPESTAVTIAVLGNDTDADGDTLVVSGVGLAVHGTAAINPDKTITYTPAPGYSGSDTFSYTIGDGHTGTAGATVTITITAVNHAPVAAGDTYTAAEDTALIVAAPLGVLANDTDPDSGTTLTASLVTGPAHGTLTLGPTGGFTYTPAPNYNGGDGFTYKANDGTVDSNVAAVTITITAVNDAPVALADAATTLEDTPVTIAVLTNDTDLDGDTLMVSGVGLAAHGTAAINPDKTITYTPAANYNGTDTFTYTIGDGQGGTASAAVTVTITAVNDAPVANNQAVVTTEDTAKAITLSATDAEGTPVTYAVVTGPAHGTLSGTAPSVTYTPAPNYHGPDAFTFKANDGSLDSSPATVTITVTSVNDVPFANDDSYTTNEDTPLTVAAPGLLANDSDLDGDVLTVSVVTGPMHGTLTLNPNGSFTYTPAANYNGADAFLYRVSDGTATDNATVTLTIVAVNDAPVANNQAVVTSEDTAKPITLSATDAEGSSLTYAVVTGPAHGTLSGTAPNVTYTPAANYNGADSFTFKANDGSLNSTPATVTINVTAVNDVPVANDDSYTTNEDTALTVAAPGVLGNDLDADGDALTASVKANPGHGTVTLNPNGSFTYTPAANFNGSDNFTYNISDGTVTDWARVTITIVAVNDAPVANNQTVATNEDTAKPITLTGTDVEGSSMTFAIVTGPAHGALSGTAPNVTYTPAANYNGPDSFTFKANDGTLDSSPATVTITVTAVNDAPVASNQAVVSDEDTAKAITLGATDVEGSTLTYAIVGGPTHGTLSGTAPNVTYTPAANYNGPDSFTFKANDGSLDSNTATVSITVTAVNDAPVASNQAVTTDEDTAKAIALGVTDLEGSALTYAIVTAPAHGTLSGTAPGLTYTPAADYNGPDSFTFKANDGSVDSNIATVTITVVAVNDAPVAGNQAVATDEDTAKAIVLSATDLEGSALTYVIGTGPAHGTLSGTAPNLTYTPAANYSGADSFTFKANDGGVDSNLATVSITVAAVNDAPVASDQAVGTDEDTAKTITLGATDVEGSVLTYVIATAPTHGALSGSAPNLTYTPSANYNGPDSFTFKANDGSLDSNVATVTISVAAVNDAPVATDQTAATDEDATRAITLSASDVEGSPLTYAIVSGPVHGTLSGTAPSVTYAPAANYNGPDSFTFKANDGSLDSNVATVTIAVAAVNDAPVASADTATTAEDTPVTIAVLGNDTDPDGDTLSVTGVSTPQHGSAVSHPDGTITYTPAANYDGADSFTYTIGDGHGGTATGTVSVSVTAVNDAPGATDQAVATAEDTATTITLSATDIEGSSLTFAVVTAPAHGTLSGAAPNLTYTPAANYNGPDSFTFKANDGSLDSNIATVSIAVTAVNDAPAAGNDAAATAEDTAVTIAVLGNDTDMDGDTLSVTGVSTPQHGTAASHPDGTITYTPAANYDGADSFTYTIGDGHGGTATGTVSVTVTAMNDAPVANADTATTAEDTAVTIAVLGNDTDPDGDTLAVTGIGTPQHGSAESHADGTITYTPAANYHGMDSFTYTIGDGHGSTATGTVSVTIASVNDAPVANADTATTAEDTPVAIAVLVNDTDLDGDSLAVTGVGTPQHGSAVGNPDGTIAYTPAANYNGTDTFTYTIGDGHGGAATGTILVTITAVNDPPTAVNDAAITNEDATVSGNVLSNDTDADGGATLTAHLVGNPTHGAVTLNADGSFSYTPAANVNGTDSFTYKANDGTADSNVATVTITVNAVNDAPLALPDAYTATEDQPLIVAAPGVLGNDTDVEGGTLTAGLVNGPAHGTLALNADGSFTYTPSANFNGPDSFTYKINDGSDDSSVATVTMTVTAVNDVPIATADTYGTNEDGVLSIEAPGVLVNDTDVEHSPLTAVLVSGPAHGTLALNPDGSFTYTPEANVNGPDSFTYKATDGTGDSNAATVTIMVNAVNDSPVAVADATTTSEDTPVTIAVRANDTDADGDAVSVSAIGQPAHGSAAINADQTVTYTPAPNYNGVDTFTYTISDGHGGTASGIVSVTVTSANDAPVANADSYSTSQYTALTVAAPGVLANDTDVEHDALTAIAASAPAHGVLTLNANGSFTYAPAAEFIGTDSFTYRAGDGSTESPVATVTIVVSAVNHAPVAADQSITAHVNVPAAVRLTAWDADADTLSFTVSANVAHGTLTGTAPNLVYTPNPGFVGMDSLSFLANDGTSDSNAATVTIRVMSGINRPPEAEDQWIFIDEDVPSPASLLAGDPEGDQLSYTIVTPPSHGTLSGVAPNLIYTPDRDFNGWDYFTFVASDGVFDSNEASVNFWIWEVNDPPVAQDLVVVTAGSVPVDGQLAVIDPEGDWFFYGLVTEPTNGTVAVDPDTGAFIYTPGPGFTGYDSFTYAAYDWQGGGNVSTIQIIAPGGTGPMPPDPGH